MKNAQAFVEWKELFCFKPTSSLINLQIQGKCVIGAQRATKSATRNLYFSCDSNSKIFQEPKK